MQQLRTMLLLASHLHCSPVTSIVDSSFVLTPNYFLAISSSVLTIEGNAFESHNYFARSWFFCNFDWLSGIFIYSTYWNIPNSVAYIDGYVLDTW